MSTASSPILRGDLKTLVRIALPLMLFLFCETLTSFIERIFLSYHSLEAVQVSLNAGYLGAVFQYPCRAIAALGQVYIGLYYGRNENALIGPCIWQLIWFSFLFFLITIPLNYGVSYWYFRGTNIQEMGMSYFKILIFANFLYPLSINLSSFYLGRGKTILVTTLMLISYALNVILCWFLVFGIHGVIPPMGIKGAPLAKCMSLALVGSIFFYRFLKRKNRAIFQTGSWQLLPKLFWKYMRKSSLQASAYLLSKICWVAISYIIIKKGGEYLDVLTIGGTVITFLVFTTSGIFKALLMIASNLIGSEKYSELWRLCRSFVICALMIAVLLSFPLIFFPNSMIYFFDSSSKEVFRQTFGRINYWVWIYLVALTMHLGFSAFIVAMRDLKYQLYCFLFLWATSLIPVYWTIGLKGWPPSTLWAITAFENIVLMCCFIFRLRYINRQEKQLLQP